MVDDVSAAEVQTMLEDDDVRIVDIRTPQGFARGHIPGSENIPFPELVQRVDETEWSGTVVMVCPHGESSEQAARLLESYEGVDDSVRVCNLADGLVEWPGEFEADALG